MNNLLIKINCNSLKSKNDIKNFISTESSIIYAAKLAGEYYYLLTIANKNNKELDEIINKFKSKFPNVKEINILPTFETLLHEYQIK